MQDVRLEALDNNEISAVIMLDLSAAFDVVDTEILLDKLSLYGFNTCALDWLASYLSNRSQQVYVDGSLSQPLPVDVGVPQGSAYGDMVRGQYIKNNTIFSGNFFVMYTKPS